MIWFVWTKCDLQLFSILMFFWPWNWVPQMPSWTKMQAPDNWNGAPRWICCSFARHCLDLLQGWQLFLTDKSCHRNDHGLWKFPGDMFCSLPLILLLDSCDILIMHSSWCPSCCHCCSCCCCRCCYCASDSSLSRYCTPPKTGPESTLLEEIVLAVLIKSPFGCIWRWGIPVYPQTTWTFFTSAVGRSLETHHDA